MRSQVPPSERFGRQNAEREQQRRDLDDALRLAGSQFVRLFEKMQALIANLQTTVTNLVNALTYTRAQIDSKIASPGNITPGNVTASGRGTFPVGVNSTGVYGTLLTYGGPYSSQYVHQDGTMGYVPSTRRLKQDIETWAFDPVVISYLRVVTFRYIDAVDPLGGEAAEELGLIAEEVHELGLHWLVDYKLVYTDEGAQAVPPYQGERAVLPFGVKLERIALVLVTWAQSIEARLDAAGI